LRKRRGWGASSGRRQGGGSGRGPGSSHGRRGGSIRRRRHRAPQAEVQLQLQGSTARPHTAQRPSTGPPSRKVSWPDGRVAAAEPLGVGAAQVAHITGGPSPVALDGCPHCRHHSAAHRRWAKGLPCQVAAGPQLPHSVQIAQPQVRPHVPQVRRGCPHRRLVCEENSGAHRGRGAARGGRKHAAHPCRGRGHRGALHKGMCEALERRHCQPRARRMGAWWRR
jgi:hypothetical protein